MKILRSGVAGALIASVPLSASVAATRPGAAVPVAGATAATAQVYDTDDRRGAIAWPAVAVIVLAAAVALWIVLDDDDDGEIALTSG